MSDQVRLEFVADAKQMLNNITATQKTLQSLISTANHAGAAVDKSFITMTNSTARAATAAARAAAVIIKADSDVIKSANNLKSVRAKASADRVRYTSNEEQAASRAAAVAARAASQEVISINQLKMVRARASADRLKSTNDVLIAQKRLETAQAKLTASSRENTAAVKDQTDKYNSFERQVGFVIRQMVGLYTIVNTVKKIFTVGFGFNQFIEGAQASFSVMLKSGAEAKELLEDLYDFAVSSPLRFVDTVGASRQLMAYGFQAQELVKTMELLGTVGTAVGVSLDDMAYVYGTLRSQGRAYTRDLMQFAMRGIPIYEELAKVMGKPIKEIQALTAEGEIGFKQVEMAFQNMVNEGGRFAGFFEEYMTTVEGKTQMLADVAQKAAGILSQGIFNAWREAIDSFTKVFNDPKILDNLKELGETVGWVATQLLKLAEILLRNIPLITGLIKAFVMLKLAALALKVLNGIPTMLNLIAMSADAAALSMSSIGTAQTLASVGAMTTAVNSLGASLKMLGATAALKGVSALFPRAGAALATGALGAAAAPGAAAGAAAAGGAGAAAVSALGVGAIVVAVLAVVGLTIAGFKAAATAEAGRRGTGMSSDTVRDAAAQANVQRQLLDYRRSLQSASQQTLTHAQAQMAVLDKNSEEYTAAATRVKALEESADRAAQAVSAQETAMQDYTDYLYTLMRSSDLEVSARDLRSMAEQGGRYEASYQDMNAIVQSRADELGSSRDRLEIMDSASGEFRQEMERIQQLETELASSQIRRFTAERNQLTYVRQLAEQYDTEEEAVLVILTAQKAITEERRAQLASSLALARSEAGRRNAAGPDSTTSRGGGTSGTVQVQRTEAFANLTQIAGAALTDMFRTTTGATRTISAQGRAAAQLFIDSVSNARVNSYNMYRTIFGQNMPDDQWKEILAANVADYERVLQGMFDSGAFGQTMTTFNLDETVIRLRQELARLKAALEGPAAAVAAVMQTAMPDWDKWITIDADASAFAKLTRFWEDYASAMSTTYMTEVRYLEQRNALAYEYAVAVRQATNVGDESSVATSLAATARSAVLMEQMRQLEQSYNRQDPIFSRAQDSGINMDTQEQYLMYIDYIKNMEAAEARYTDYVAALREDLAKAEAQLTDDTAANDAQALVNRASLQAQMIMAEIDVRREVDIQRRAIDKRYFEDSMEQERKRLRKVGETAAGGDMQAWGERANELIGRGVEAGSTGAGFSQVATGVGMNAISGTEVGKLAAGGDPVTMALMALTEFAMSIENVTKILNPFKTVIEAMRPILEPLINGVLQPIVNILEMLGEAVAQVLSPFLMLIQVVTSISYMFLTVLDPVFLAINILGNGFAFIADKVIMPFGNFVINLINALIKVANKLPGVEIRLLGLIKPVSAAAEDFADIIAEKSRLLGNTLSWLTKKIQEEADKQRTTLQDLWEVGAISTSEYESQISAINEQMLVMDEERLLIEEAQLASLTSMLELWKTYTAAQALLEKDIDVDLTLLPGLMKNVDGTLLTVGTSVDSLVANNLLFMQYMDAWFAAGGGDGGGNTHNTNTTPPPADRTQVMLDGAIVQGIRMAAIVAATQAEVSRMSALPWYHPGRIPLWGTQAKLSLQMKELDKLRKRVTDLGGTVSFAKGSTNIPQDMNANIHKGEGIVPSSFMDGVRRGDISISGPSGGRQNDNNGVYVTVNVAGSVRADKDLAKVIADEIYTQTKRGKI